MDQNPSLFDRCEDSLQRDDASGLSLLLQAHPELLQAKLPLQRNRTLLLVAAELGATECLQFLLDQPTLDRHALDRNGKTALMLAAAEGRLEGVLRLLSANDANALDSATDAGFDNALMLALRGGHTSCAQALLAHTDLTHLNRHGYNALMIAAMFCSSALPLLMPHLDVNAQVPQESPGREQRRVGDLPDQGQTALMLAAKKGATRSLKILLPASDATLVDAWGRDALFFAVSHAQTDATLLLAQGRLSSFQPYTHPCCQGLNALMLAAYAFEDVSTVIDALLPFCDPRAVDSDGRDALRHAAEGTKKRNIEVLAPYCAPLRMDHHGMDAFDYLLERNEEARGSSMGYARSTAECLLCIAELVLDPFRIEQAIPRLAPQDLANRDYFQALAQRLHLKQALQDGSQRPMPLSGSGVEPNKAQSPESDSHTPRASRRSHLRL